MYLMDRIVTEEGVKALWKAGTHTIARSMIISAAQIGTYAKVSSTVRYACLSGTRVSETPLLFHQRGSRSL